MDFYSDVWEGEVYLRDKFQFDLKSEYSPVRKHGKNQYTLDFFFFIPKALQINRDTYSREEFYHDLSSLIRYKTPSFTLHELIDPENDQSPLVRISRLLNQETMTEEESKEILFEIKLFGNMFRSTLRDDVLNFMRRLEQEKLASDLVKLDRDLMGFCVSITALRKRYTSFVDQIANRKIRSPLSLYTKYVDEFISNKIEKYLTRLLKELVDLQLTDTLHESEEKLYDLIAYEVSYRKGRGYRSPVRHERKRHREHTLYRAGLLKKFVLDVLLLSTYRKHVSDQFRHLIGSFAAGVAMLGYMLLFVWQGNVFVINSMPFVFATVLIYILKDRVKEALRDMDAYKRLWWYPDYATKVRTPDGKTILGILKESFSYVSKQDLPSQIRSIRDHEFHVEVPEFERHEKVFHYQRQVKLNSGLKKMGARRFELNDIFRFNVRKFCQNASGPDEINPYLDLGTGQVVEMEDPKVYHINIVLKKTYTTDEGVSKTEHHKFRLVVSKGGILRVERLDGLSKWLNFPFLRRPDALPSGRWDSRAPHGPERPVRQAKLFEFPPSPLE